MLNGSKAKQTKSSLDSFLSCNIIQTHPHLTNSLSLPISHNLPLASSLTHHLSSYLSSHRSPKDSLFSGGSFSILILIVQWSANTTFLRVCFVPILFYYPISLQFAPMRPLLLHFSPFHIFFFSFLCLSLKFYSGLLRSHCSALRVFSNPHGLRSNDHVLPFYHIHLSCFLALSHLNLPVLLTFEVNFYFQCY